MRRKYWQLPIWLPVGVRNFILSYEPFDDDSFKANCQSAHNLRFGPIRALFNHPNDWEFTAAQCGIVASERGISRQWLAERWAETNSIEIVSP